MRHARRSSRGFSLLEAIVALTIFSAGALTLYGWLSVNVTSLGRAEARTDALRDARAGLALIETINPLAEPRGTRDIGALTIEWAARPVAERRTGATPVGRPSVFDLALYDVDVVVLREGSESYRFTVRRAGWESVRSSGLFDD